MRMPRRRLPPPICTWHVLGAAVLVCVATWSLARAGSPDCRPSANQKGSLLVFPAVEIQWDGEGNLTQDTIISLTNDIASDVYIQLHYVNGDAPLEAVYGKPGEKGEKPELIERSHPGWNSLKCEGLLTCDQPMYFSAFSGRPLGVVPFSNLDPSGRPDGSDSGRRHLRGYVLAWAVDRNGAEIHWNHLAGTATTVNFADGSAFEYEAYVLQARSGSNGFSTDDNPGQLLLNGVEYDALYETLLLNFFSSGDQDPSLRGIGLPFDTDLTLMPVQSDLRGKNFGPVRTFLRFDVWNQNEHHFGTSRRMITMWDQELLSRHPEPSYFTREQLQTDVGYARIDGLANVACDPFAIPAALVGVSNRVIDFSKYECQKESSARTLPGDGCEEAAITYDAQPVRLCGREGDCNGNGLVEVGDVLEFNLCISGPGEKTAEHCVCADFDEDGDVDLLDIAFFQRMAGRAPSAGSLNVCEGDDR